METLPFLEKKNVKGFALQKLLTKSCFQQKITAHLLAVFHGGAPVAQWVKHWPTDQADPV